jgi:flagellar motor switch protein FliN/FliY
METFTEAQPFDDTFAGDPGGPFGDDLEFAGPAGDPAGEPLADPAGEPLPGPAAVQQPAAEAPDLARLRAVPVELAVEIGRTRMTIGDALSLAPGSIITLNRMAGEPVDLLVNGRAIARGEVVVIDEEFGLRVTEVVTGPQAEE